MDYQAKDVDEAIEVATKLREKDGYDLFRGQVRSEWKPYTSLMRLLEGDANALGEVRQKMSRFFAWLQATPGLSAIAENEDAAIAIAQHYGIPTHFLDFTTEPAVAGFFAADTASPQLGTESCIFCLKSADLLEFWNDICDIMEKSGGPVVHLELVRPKVPNLWRLQAQHGVFLFAPTNWDLHYRMDRVLFPSSGYPRNPTSIPSARASSRFYSISSSTTKRR